MDRTRGWRKEKGKEKKKRPRRISWGRGPRSKVGAIPNIRPSLKPPNDNNEQGIGGDDFPGDDFRDDFPSLKTDSS